MKTLHIKGAFKLIQILGIRDGEGHTFFEKGYTAQSVEEILARPKQIIHQIPEEDRYNLYFTVHHCHNKEPRDFSAQTIIPFDIDDVNPDKKEETARLVCEIIGLDFNKTGILWSGHGLQLFVKIESKIEDAGFFTQNRELYKLIAQRVNHKLQENELAGKMDTAVFSVKRLMRMPETWNRKPKKGKDEWAFVIQSHMEYQGFALETSCGAPNLKQGESITKTNWVRAPRADTVAVLAGCEFLKHCHDNQSTVTEEQWYALAGVVGFLDNGIDLFHKYSEKYPGYSREETDFKVQQATKTTGPRTCGSIEKVWDGCQACPHYRTSIKTPCAIKSPDYIATEFTGFHYIKYNANGDEKGKEPAFEDLVKYFKRTVGDFFTHKGTCYYYDKEAKHYKIMESNSLAAFAYKHFSPAVRSNVADEFKKTIQITNDKPEGVLWMHDSSARKLNLQNGVLDLETNELLTHSKDFGFMSVLPYDYTPEAKAPRFEKFLKDITCDRDELSKILLEFMGYAISGDECFIHKALILFGEGRNGKSTFNKVLAALVGDGYFSSLSMSAINNDQKRAMLEGKLFNIGDENVSAALLEAEVFKALVAGGMYDIKTVYRQPYSVKNKTKLIFNCNEMPTTKDTSVALFERLLFIPFDAVFLTGNTNTDPRIEYKLYEELPGILNMCIEGYRRLKAQASFTKAESSEEIKDDFRANSDTFTSWFNDQIVPEDSDNKIDLDSLYVNYCSYCEAKGDRFPKTKNVFGGKLTQRAKSDTKFKYRRVLINGNRRFYLLGAKIHGPL